MFRIKGFEKRDKAHFVLLKIIEMYFKNFISSHNESKRPDALPGYKKDCRKYLDLLEEFLGALTVIEIPEEDEIEFRNRLREIANKYQEVIKRDDIIMEYVGVIFDSLPREENPY
jgi:hypothetical protein